jgi:hypothetical protein
MTNYETWLGTALSRVDWRESHTHEVDKAMMGQEWRGTDDHLVAFVDILQGFNPDRHIEAITDSYNGAQHDNDDVARGWAQALVRHIERFPEAWQV